MKHDQANPASCGCEVCDQLQINTRRGPCAKRQVVCTLIGQSGTVYIGSNDCAMPQAVCPRAEGEGYEKCRTICGQGGHAEIEALRLAGADARGGVAWLTGHYWICEPCGAALRDAGVRSVFIDPQHR